MKTVFRMLLLTAAALLLCLPLGAQEKAKAAQTEKPAAKKAAKPAAAAMPMPKPSPEMTKLIKTLAGTWNTTEKHEPEFMPGGTGQGRAVLHAGPGGLSLIEDYKSKGALGSFQGHGVLWWDDKAKVYKGVWCDNGTPTGCDTGGESKWEGDQIVGQMSMEMMGKKMSMKMLYSNITPNSFTFTMDTSVDGGPMKRTMTIEYTRAEAKAPASKPAEKKP